jgi:hypothetical protein
VCAGRARGGRHVARVAQSALMREEAGESEETGAVRAWSEVTVCCAWGGMMVVRGESRRGCCALGCRLRGAAPALAAVSPGSQPAEGRCSHAALLISAPQPASLLPLCPPAVPLPTVSPQSAGHIAATQHDSTKNAASARCHVSAAGLLPSRQQLSSTRAVRRLTSGRGT